jgi:hypothetical protein
MTNDLATDPLTIVVAMTDPAPPAFAEHLARFAEEAGELGEVYVVDSSGTLSVEWLARRYANVRVLHRPIGRLAPQLWRDGLIRSEAPLVAFTTAQMRLSEGWRVAMVDRLIETNASGVGGPIEPGSTLTTTDRAVALLRYSSYFPPMPSSIPPEPPGDNALYRRDRLCAVESSWKQGFWEVEVHQALRKRGETLAMADRAVATYEGGTRLFVMSRQRVRHAKHYGASRSRGSSTAARMVRVAASPLVPPLLCGRIVRNLRGRGLRLVPWITSLPRLLLLASAWAVGEAIGTWSASSILPDANA